MSTSKILSTMAPSSQTIMIHYVQMKLDGASSFRKQRGHKHLVWQRQHPTTKEKENCFLNATVKDGKINVQTIIHFRQIQSLSTAVYDRVLRYLNYIMRREDALKCLVVVTEMYTKNYLLYTKRSNKFGIEWIERKCPSGLVIMMMTTSHL